MPSDSPGSGSLSRLASWLGLGLVVFCVYLLTASQQYDADVLGELRSINHLDVSSPDPAHMLYVRMGVPFYRLWLAAGYRGDALTPMQILNAFFGAGTIMLFALALRHLRVRWQLILLMSSAVAFSYAFWTHTVDAFFIIPAAFFAITALTCAFYLSSARSPGRRGILVMLLGGSLGLAVLSYQANLALIPALLAASWPTPRKDIAPYVKNWLAAAVIASLIAGSAWLGQAVTSGGIREPQGLIAWFLSGHGGMKEGLWRREGVNLLTTMPIAWIATILPVYEGLGLHSLLRGILSPDRLSAQLALGILGLTLLFATLVIVRRPSLLRSKAVLTAALWFLLPGVAVTWFDPAEVKLWLIPMFGFWMVLAFTLSSSGQNDGQRRGVTLLVSTLALLIAVGNFLIPVWPNHRHPSANLAAAQQAVKYLKPTDVIFSAGFDWTGYLDYVSDEVRSYSLLWVAQTYGKQSVKPFLEREILATWQQGGRVFVVDYFKPNTRQVWEEWITPFTSLTPDDLDDYERTAAWQTDQGDTIWELKPLK